MTGQQPPPGGWQPPPGQPPQWPQVPPPQPPPSSGRLVAYIIVGGLLGMVAGAFAASLLDAALNFGLLLPVVMLIAAPAGGLLGALWGMRQGRRGRRSPRPMEEWRRRPNRIVDVRRDQNER